MSVSEYLDHLFAAGFREEDFPQIQPSFQKRIWDRFDKAAGEKSVDVVIEKLRQEDPRFHVEGGSWTADRSWVQGYENVLGPMQSASALFAEKVLKSGVPSSDPRYRNALFHLLTSQTSCFRYWGQGSWTDYGVELCRRTVEHINRDFPG
jgi:hypothetical protein